MHLPNTPETDGWLDAEAFAKMRDGVRILNVARGSLIVDADLKDALDSGKVAGAALDVFRSEPMTDHPLFGYPNVIVTPHLGASTTEANDRAGYQAAEQIVAALQGGSVTTAVNAATIKPEDIEELGPFLPLCRHLGRLGTQLALCGSIDGIEVECLGRIAERDTRPLVTAVLLGALARPHRGAHQRGQRARARRGARHPRARDVEHDRARLHRPRARQRRLRLRQDDGRRHDDRQPQPPASPAGLGPALQPPARAAPVAVSLRRRPGVIGRVGTIFGERGFNIGSAAVGHSPDNGEQQHAVMIMTTDAQVPQALVDEIIASSDLFVAGRTVTLD